MRIAVLGLSHEANTFAPHRVDNDVFAAACVLRGQQILARHAEGTSTISGFLAETARQGVEIVPLVMTTLVPSGVITAAALKTQTDELITALADSGPFDGVLVSSHGTAVADDVADVDGYLLRRFREVVGTDVPIGVSLDLHANITAQMCQYSDVLSTYRTNPPVDAKEVAEEVAAVTIRAARGEIRPTQAFQQVPAVIGLSVVVVTEASELADRVWARRAEFDATATSIGTAMALAIRAPRGPVLLLDVGDNIGGGAPGDSVVLLHAARHARLRRLLITIVDAAPVAAGIGTQVHLTVGATTTPETGPPIEAHARVLALHDGAFEAVEAVHAGMRHFDAGQSAAAGYQPHVTDIVRVDTQAVTSADPPASTTGSADARSSPWIPTRRPELNDRPTGARRTHMADEGMNRRTFLTNLARTSAAGIAVPALMTWQSRGAPTARASITGTDYFVTTQTQLTNAIASAAAGDTITMQNRTWSNLNVVIGATANHGTASAPITLRAQTGGSVILNQVSNLALGRDHWVIDGLVFQEGYSTDEVPVINLQADGNDANHALITNVKIDSYNPPDGAAYEWVRLRGTYNEVRWCYFAGKTNFHDLLQGRGEAAPTPRHHRVERCYFGDIPNAGGENGHGAVTPTQGQWPEVFDQSIVAHNLFRRCSGESEIISIKTSGATVAYNTFEDCYGYVSLRAGNGSQVYGNYIFSNSGGIRVTGEDHRIFNNYIDGTTSAFLIHNGSPAYAMVRNVQIMNNTIVDSVSRGFVVGYPDASNPDDNVPPESFTLANNIVKSSTGQHIEYRAIPTSPAYVSNIMHGAPVGISPVPAGVQAVDPQLVATSVGGHTVRKPSSSSPAIDAATGSYNVPIDIEGKSRPSGAASDIGAHERSTAPLLYPPKTGADVGPHYMTIP